MLFYAIGLGTAAFVAYKLEGALSAVIVVGIMTTIAIVFVFLEARRALKKIGASVQRAQKLLSPYRSP